MCADSAGQPQAEVFVPRLDVVVPYYRGEDYLRTTVASVVAMPGRAWRLTVVDENADGDAAQRVLAEVAGGRGDQVRLVRNERTLGVAGNFNRCVEVAQAPVCTLLGADDVVLPNYADVVLGAMGREPGVDVVQPGVQVIDAGGQVWLPPADRVKRFLAPRRRKVLQGQSFAASLMHGDWLYFPSLAWRTEALRRFRFDPDLATGMDLQLILEMVSAGHRFAFDPQVCFGYRRHAGSVSSQNAGDCTRFDEEQALHRQWARRFQEMGWRWAAMAASMRVTSRAHHAMQRLSL